MRYFLIFAFALIFAAPAGAQDYKTLLDLPEGATLVNLSVSEMEEVEQDLLTASVRYEAEDADAATLQDDVNQMMSKALKAAQKISSVKASTQGYHVYQYDRSRGKGTRRDMVWKGSQALVLKGKKADDLLNLVSDLQEMGLAMNGLDYSISPELSEATRDGLLEKALAKLQTKAAQIAKALGKSKSEILEINVNMSTGGLNHAPVRAMMMESSLGMAKADMAAPVAAPGEQNIALSVNAQALVK